MVTAGEDENKQMDTFLICKWQDEEYCIFSPPDCNNIKVNQILHLIYLTMSFFSCWRFFFFFFWLSEYKATQISQKLFL